MIQKSNISGIIYDLDGTIVDTERFHREAWELTSREYGFGLSGEQLYFASKGISSKKTLERCLPLELHGFIDQAAEAKFRSMIHLMEHAFIELLPGFMETYEALRADKLSVGICTSARQENVEALRQNKTSSISSILESLVGKVAWIEMYKEGKPAAEPLLLTCQLIGVDKGNVLYVGDALADYKCAQNAGVHFVYFCGENATPDEKIPSTVQRIMDHRELIELLE